MSSETCLHGSGPSLLPSEFRRLHLHLKQKLNQELKFQGLLKQKDKINIYAEGAENLEKENIFAWH